MEKVESHLSMDLISEKLVSGQCGLATQVIQEESASNG